MEDGVTVSSADGPPIALAATADPEDPTSPRQAGRNWSRVRLINRPLLKSSSTALQLEVAGDSLNATARVTVKIDPRRVEPLRMIVEPGWSLDSVSFVHSGRVIEHSTVKGNSRVFVLWPEAEDANESEIVIEAKGTKILSGKSAGLLIPPTWFVRTLDARGEFPGSHRATGGFELERRCSDATGSHRILEVNRLQSGTSSAGLIRMSCV